MKTCGGCDEEKPEDEFPWRNRSRGVRASTCKACKKRYSRRWYERNGEKHRSHVNARRNETFRQYRYGLDHEDYLAMVDAQRGNCWICRRPLPLQVDHCHETGDVRGLLCGGCNRGLGAFEDDDARLRRALEYLALARGSGT